MCCVSKPAVLQAVFSTLTNVNFDAGRFVSFLEKADEWLQYARNEARSKGWFMLAYLMVVFCCSSASLCAF